MYDQRAALCSGSNSPRLTRTHQRAGRDSLHLFYAVDRVYATDKAISQEAGSAESWWDLPPYDSVTKQFQVVSTLAPKENIGVHWEMIALEFSFTASGDDESHDEPLQASIAAKSAFSEKCIQSAEDHETNRGIAVGSSM